MDYNLIERRRASFEECFAHVIPEQLEWCEIRQQYHGHHSWWIWTDKLQTWNAALDSAVVELPGDDGMDGHLWGPDVVDAIERAGLRVKS